MSTDQIIDDDQETLSGMIESSLDTPDYWLCDACDWNNEEGRGTNHGNCAVTILVFPNGFQESMACKCECNRDNWETAADVAALKEQERIAAL